VVVTSEPGGDDTGRPHMFFGREHSGVNGF
jgi:hypothetical protein